MKRIFSTARPWTALNVFLNGIRIFVKAEASSYQAAAYSSLRLQWFQIGKDPLEAAVSEYYTSGLGAEEDHATGRIQSCPAEEKVMLIERFKSKGRTFSSFWF